MQKTHLEYNVRKAIEALQHLQSEGYKVEDNEALFWKDKFAELCSEIDSHLREAQALYNDLKENGLTAGAIEAEGFLRGAKFMANMAQEIADREDQFED